jgi:hypothetical protein
MLPKKRDYNSCAAKKTGVCCCAGEVQDTRDKEWARYILEGLSPTGLVDGHYIIGLIQFEEADFEDIKKLVPESLTNRWQRNENR